MFFGRAALPVTPPLKAPHMVSDIGARQQPGFCQIGEVTVNSCPVKSFLFKCVEDFCMTQRCRGQMEMF
jgi:hypothetical protein